MARVDFAEAGKFARPSADFAANLSPVLTRTVEAFVENVDRAYSLWFVTPRLFDVALRTTQLIYEARDQLKQEGSGEPEKEAIFKRLLEPAKDLLNERGVSDDRVLGYDTSRAALRIDDICQEDPNAQKGLLSAMEGQLLQIFTAIESVSSDLWVDAVNASPKQLVMAWANSPQTKGDKSISLTEIHLADYDLQKRMGTILRTLKKVSFQSLNETKEAYAKTFGDNGKKLFQDKQLLVLELVRNLLAHQGGRIDGIFKKNIEGLDHPFGTLIEDDKIQLNGTIVRDLCAVVVAEGKKAIRMVNGWLAANP
jgi:hypothetical protein